MFISGESCSLTRIPVCSSLWHHSFVVFCGRRSVSAHTRRWGFISGALTGQVERRAPGPGCGRAPDSSVDARPQVDPPTDSHETGSQVAMSDGASCRTSVTRIQASARRRAMTRPAADGGEVAINPWAASPVRRRAAFCPQATIRRLVMDKVHPKVEEAIDTLNMQDGPTRRRLLKGTGLVSATAAASALLAACSSSSSASPSTSASAASTAGNFPKTPPWKFTFVNHVTTNPFFVPTQYGLQDAAALLGMPEAQAGPDRIDLERAADGQRDERRDLGERERDRGRSHQRHRVQKPDVPGNDGWHPRCLVQRRRQRPERSGHQPARPTTVRISSHRARRSATGSWLPRAMSGGGDAVGFIATPGASNIQPRIDGAKSAIKASGKNINFTAITSGAELPQENTDGSMPTYSRTRPPSRASSRWTRARPRP